MKQLLIATAMITIGTSTISTLAHGSEHYGKPITTELPAQTVIKNAPGHVKVLRVPKPKLFRSNPHRAVHYALTDDDDDIPIDDDTKITGYRKRDLNKVKSKPTVDDPDGDVTENVRWKLFLARQAALLIHQQKWG